MNIDKKYLIIISCAFICGILFCISIVLAVLWGYKMGQENKNTVVQNTSQNPQGDNNLNNVSFSPTEGYESVIPISNTLVQGQSSDFTPVPGQSNLQYNMPTQPSQVSQIQPQGDMTQKQIDPQVKQQITDYMYNVDGVLKETKTWNNPEQFAQELIGSTLKGDPSGFNNLIAAYETSKSKLMALSVPKECQEYHSSCIDLIDKGTGMLGKLKMAINSQDMNQIMGIQKEAVLLEQQAKAVDKISAKLFKEYDIPPPK
jgi:hypothetical protein